MMTTPIDPRVEAYLRQLDFALSTLPWEQRNEIFTDISAHIERELAVAGHDPAAIDSVLQRVGDPHAIAQEAGAVPALPMPLARPGRGLEIAAVILISAGSFLIPVLGWIVGVVLLWVSRRFTRADKLIGMLVPPLGFFAPFALLLMSSSSSSGPCVSRVSSAGGSQTFTGCAVTSHSTHAWLGVTVLLVLLAAAVFTVVRLSRRVARMG
jgi:uncharacterized membrane protein